MSMPQRQSEQSSDQNGPRRVRFAADTGFTFINYGPDDGGFAYRREAREHNAQRRASRSANVTSTGSPQTQQSLVPRQSESLLDPLSTFARDPFHRVTTQSTSSIEQTWYTIFPHFFGLPQLRSPLPTLRSPSTIFLTTAKASDDLYRSIVLQVVATANVEAGISDGDALLQNQALILRDFRTLVGTYGTSIERLSSTQFQHVFASAFSFSGRGFDKEAGYNAIVLMNSLFMSAKQHVSVVQTPVSEWFRMLMPRPGPTFDRSREFQHEMLGKIELALDFLERVQDALDTPYPSHVSRYLGANSALYKIVTMRIPDRVATEPYSGFYLICRHRVLSMLLRHLDHVAQIESAENKFILDRLESLASVCLEYSSPQSIALFLWCQISTAETTGLNRDQDEPLFAWAIKDLLFVHELDFADEMAAWVVWKAQRGGIVQPEVLNITAWRERMHSYYVPESRSYKG